MEGRDNLVEEMAKKVKHDNFGLTFRNVKGMVTQNKKNRINKLEGLKNAFE